MAWLYLILAGVFEIAWAFGLKASQGFSLFWPSVLTVVCMAISVVLLALAMKTLPLGTSYAVWTGIGTVGSVVIGILFFAESRDPLRLLCVFLIVAGIVGLKLLSTP